MTIIIDHEVCLRNYPTDGNHAKLTDYCRDECREKCGIEIAAPADEFGEYMTDCDCPVALFYFMAVGHAEIRARLKYHEDLMEEGAET
jgi:hypothetical protein